MSRYDVRRAGRSASSQAASASSLPSRVLRQFPETLCKRNRSWQRRRVAPGAVGPSAGVPRLDHAFVSSTANAAFTAPGERKRGFQLSLLRHRRPSPHLGLHGYGGCFTLAMDRCARAPRMRMACGALEAREQRARRTARWRHTSPCRPLVSLPCSRSQRASAATTCACSSAVSSRPRGMPCHFSRQPRQHVAVACCATNTGCPR